MDMTLMLTTYNFMSISFPSCKMGLKTSSGWLRKSEEVMHVKNTAHSWHKVNAQ